MVRDRIREHTVAISVPDKKLIDISRDLTSENRKKSEARLGKDLPRAGDEEGVKMQPGEARASRASSAGDHPARKYSTSSSAKTSTSTNQPGPSGTIAPAQSSDVVIDVQAGGEGEFSLGNKNDTDDPQKFWRPTTRLGEDRTSEAVEKSPDTEVPREFGSREERDFGKPLGYV